MKTFQFVGLILLFIVGGIVTSAHAEAANTGSLKVNLHFKRSKTYSSNQYAIWIENAQGQVIRTVYATRFTAKGGYERRKEALALWVQKTNPSGLNDKQIDALTGATPATDGNYTYVWDGKDDAGRPVKKGVYTVYIEGTLYTGNHVVYSGKFNLNGKKQQIKLTPKYTLKDNTNRDMLTQVRAEYNP